MQTVLIVAALWATADPAPDVRQPIGPWLTDQTRFAINRIEHARTKINQWVEKSLDVAFDIQALSLTDDAAKEIRFVAELDERQKGSIVIPKERIEAVRSMATHILAAGDAGVAAEHTVVTQAGTPGTAAQYVKVGVPYVDPMGVTRVGLMKRPSGDSFRVWPTDVTLSSTKFSITIYADRLPGSGVAANEFTSSAKLNLGESLVIYRDAASPAVVQASRVGLAGLVDVPERPAQAALIIVTPRRVVRAGESKPRSL